VQSTAHAIRRYESRDLVPFLDLYETVFDDDRDEEWFDWKYRQNPYVDHVPMLVATDDSGRIIGARPFLALPLAIEGRRELALQPCDTMVHPDHRRQGLFTRMTERAIERYADHEAALFFNFPNEHSRAGYEKVGWEPIGQVRTRYRLHQPSDELSGGSTTQNIAGSVANVVQRGYLGILDRLAQTPRAMTVSKHESSPLDELLTLYRSATPSGVHVLRDDPFFRWRFENPTWTYRYYLVHERGEPIAGAIVGQNVREAGHIRITDVIPLTPTNDATAALLAAIIDDNQDANAILAPSTLPWNVCTRFGFLSDTRLPLSVVSSPTTLVARPATRDGDVWPPGLQPARTRSNWSITFAERDTS